MSELVPEPILNNMLCFLKTNAKRKYSKKNVGGKII